MTVSYEVSPQFARRAFRRHNWRTWGGVHAGVLIAFVMGILGTVYGREAWVYGFLVGVGAAYGCVWWAISVSFKRASRALFGHQVTLQVEEDALRFSTDGVSSHIDWKTLASVWRYKDMWFLIGRYIDRPYAIPGHALSAEVRSMIERKVREAGGKIL